MQASALLSRIEEAEALYEKLVHRMGCFVVRFSNGVHCRIAMPAAMVKHQAPGFIDEIIRLRTDLLKLSRDLDHESPAWMVDYVFNEERHDISEDESRQALVAAAANLGADPDAISFALGAHGYRSLIVI